MTMKIKKLIAGFLMLAVMTAMLPGQMLVSFAATGKITFSDPSVTVGNQVSVTMKITSTSGEGLGASDVMLEYDSSALEFISGTSANGGAGSVRVLGTMESEGQTTFSFTLKFKALKAGTTPIKIKSQEVYDSASQAVSISHVGSSAVKVNAPATYSKEAALSSLEISPGQLSPAFSPDVTSYTASVSGDVSKVTVSAPAKDSKARVVVSGNDDLQVGENTIVCKVTAEDGETVKNYTIVVTKSEGTAEEPDGSGASVPVDANAQGSGMNVTIGDKTWQVAQSFDAGALPEGFMTAEYTYNGTAVQSGYNEADGIRLLYLSDDSGSGDFFIYDEAAGSFAPYVTVRMAEKTIVVLPKESIPEDMKLPDGFVDCTIDIGNYSVHGWIWKTPEGSTPEYCVVYGMNSDGEKNLYRYDQKEMTLQRYFSDPDAEDLRAKYLQVAQEFNDMLEDYKIRGYIMAGLFAACIILVIVLIVILLMRKPKGPSARAYGDPEPERYGRASAKSPKSRRGSDRSRDDYDDGYEEDYDRGLDGDRYDEPASYGKPARRHARPAADNFSYDSDEIEDLDDEFEDAAQARREAPAGRTTRTQRTPAPKNPRSVADVERDIAANLAKEAGRSSSRDSSGEDDDFEFIDLDL